MKIYLDDVRYPGDTYKSKGWITCRDVGTAMTFLRLGGITHVSLDGDLGTDGKGGELPGGIDLLQWMIRTNTWPSDQVLVHSANPAKREDMERMIERYFIVTGGYETC